MENQKGFKISQYACAVLLVVSSIALVAYQVVKIDDVAGGLLYYVAQSFLLAGSIFGLDQYIRIINKHYHEREGASQSLRAPFTFITNNDQTYAKRTLCLVSYEKIGDFLWWLRKKSYLCNQNEET